MQKSIHEFERQTGKMAIMQNVKPLGALPSDTEKNHKECKAVNLRNGRELEEVPPKKKNVAEAELIPAKRAEPEPKVVEQPVEEVVRPPPHFPQRLHNQKADSACKKFLKLLKQVHINIPLVELLQEVPKYAKYIKDVVANKRRWTEFETLVDRSLAYPDSIIEDVLVKVGLFILPVDFVILDYEADKSVPLIMGRAFLAAVDAVIRVRDGKMSMTVDR
ncbi:uncharacterized protein LOC132639283 [Lycium barbarum]|uniref:uncharacterized protein LOC132639283 n=1 Tax=Lycium barbarum TaxID=112863 RepID=UPI00293F7011|nr:uncharacterized protein LOC132639283 [Lycium barbarum]